MSESHVSKARGPRATRPVFAQSTTFATAQELATAFGGAIYLPTHSDWMHSQRAAVYRLERFPSGGPEMYRIEDPLSNRPRNIVGFYGSVGERDGREGWQAAEELRPIGGLLHHRDDGTVDGVVQMEDQVVNLLGCRSAAEAIAVATSLRRLSR